MPTILSEAKIETSLRRRVLESGVFNLDNVKLVVNSLKG
jgi:hypothetical protein